MEKPPLAVNARVLSEIALGARHEENMKRLHEIVPNLILTAASAGRTSIHINFIEAYKLSAILEYADFIHAFGYAVDPIGLDRNNPGYGTFSIAW